MSLLVGSLGCADPTEPPVPPVSFNHVCCASAILIPFADDGRWTELSVVPAGGTSGFTFFISMTHPLEQPVPPGGGSLGSFPGSTQVQLVVQGCDTAINLCFTARTRRLSGDEASGQIRFGAELNQAQNDFGDFLYDVFLVPVTPPDTLAVELTLVRDSVGPVMAQLFDAVTQVAESLRPRRRAERTDTVRVHIRARYLPSGLPAVGASLRVITGPVSGSGGHGHFGNRPGGTFFRPGEDVDVPDGGVRGQVRFTLPESGDTVLVFRTSGVGGRELLVAQVSDALQSQARMDTVVIRWPGLVAMVREGAHHEFKDQDPNVPAQRHGNVNHWVEAKFQDRVLDAFQRYFEAVPEPRFPLPAPGGGRDTRFVVTEASLEWGGLFDVDTTAPWRNSHRTHRKGVDMDVRSTTLGSVSK